MINQDELNDLLAEANEPDGQNTFGVTGRILSSSCLEISINSRAIGAEQANMVFTRICSLSINADQHLILNLNGCRFLSSYVIGQLVNMATERNKRGFRMAIVEASEMILEVLRLTSMNKVIEVYPNTEDARKEFTSPSKPS